MKALSRGGRQRDILEQTGKVEILLGAQPHLIITVIIIMTVVAFIAAFAVIGVALRLHELLCDIPGLLLLCTEVNQLGQLDLVLFDLGVVPHELVYLCLWDHLAVFQFHLLSTCVHPLRSLLKVVDELQLLLLGRLDYLVLELLLRERLRLFEDAVTALRLFAGIFRRGL